MRRFFTQLPCAGSAPAKAAAIRSRLRSQSCGEKAASSALIDPPHRMLLRWDRQGTYTATSEPTFIEITLIPTDGGTTVRVEFSGR